MRQRRAFCGSLRSALAERISTSMMANTEIKAASAKLSEKSMAVLGGQYMVSMTWLLPVSNARVTAKAKSKRSQKSARMVICLQR